MDKKIIAGFVATFVLSVLATCCIVHCQNYSRDLKSVAGNKHCSMMANKEEADMGHSVDSMEHQMMTMTGALEGKTGDELDLAFLQQMIVHHEGAVMMAKKLVAGTNRPELKKMGEDIIRVQNQEIEQMESWLTTWFGK